MNLSPEVISTLVTFLVGGGLVTLVTQIVRGVTTLRTGARASTRAVIVDLAATRDEAEDRAAARQRDLEYYRDACGAYRFQMIQAGLSPKPATLIPPSERVETAKRKREPDSKA